MTDTPALQRFIEAQDPVYQAALRELTNGRKQTHWMWFIFPQIAGLGKSEISRTYAIHSLEEARDYLQHPVLGERLRECTRCVLQLDGVTAEAIFGYPDYLKFRSCMTLFSLVENEDSLFNQVLNKYYQGHKDAATLKLANSD